MRDRGGEREGRRERESEKGREIYNRIGASVNISGDLLRRGMIILIIHV